jgi:PAS domain S-box-containing protein
MTVDPATELGAIARLAAIVESSADAMIGKTLDGVITTWNSGAERMYGYTAEEILGRNVSLLIPTKWLDELPGILQRVASGERIEQYETERLRKNGSLVDVSVTISPIRDRAGAIVGASTVTRDISERKRADADLRDLQERLHQAERLESVGQLAGGIAHDFNNLLAGIINYAALVSDGLTELTGRLGLGGDETAVTLKHDIGEIDNAAARAARLTRQLLVFSRREMIKYEILDLNSVVIDMESLLRRTLGENFILETALAPDLPRTKGDRGQTEQVLMNLAVNARDAMTDGGTLRIETATYEVDDHDGHQRAISSGQYVRLVVSDTGRGMPLAVAARAFEPFFTTKAKGEGAGLGLATVYGIVAQAGGQVVITSRPRSGTSVEILLPSTQDIPTVTPEKRHSRPHASRGETILLVEDEEIVREPTRRILIGHGYTVLAAASAEEALHIAGEHQGEIHLLLTDVVMPGRSGTDLAARLSRTRTRTKVIYMSGYTSDATATGSISDTRVNLIEKPFTSPDLLRTVREVLDRD